MVARQALVDSLQEGILIVDADGRIVDLNRRLAAVAGWDAARVLGRTLAEGSTSEPSLHAALSAAVAESPATDDPACDRPPPRPPPPTRGDAEAHYAPVVVVAGRSFDVRSFVVAPSDRLRTSQPGAARVVVLHDVTERQQWEDEQARLIAELQSALRQVKTLRGLLPICARCKQIRDDVGRWHPLEEYLPERTDAQFSHGMCPACVEQWSPGVLASPPSPP